MAILACAGLDVIVLTPAMGTGQAPLQRAGGELSASDQAHYRKALALQRAGDTGSAKAELSQVEEPLLREVVLAQTGGDDVKSAVAAGRGVTNGYSRSILREKKGWQDGLQAYKRNNMVVAAHHFRTLADSKDVLPAEDRAAASFWAYRALKAEGNLSTAKRYLDKASDQPLGFYSLLARTLMGEMAVLPDMPVASLTVEQRTALLQHVSAQRAVALQSLGEEALAEKELRALYPKADRATRAALLALVKELNLPAAQMHMAGSGGTNDAFPLPKWEPVSGYQVERALLFAIMRQESGFNPNARSASGAVGLMQLMPDTVTTLTRGGHAMGQSAEPAVNMALGQCYLERLMDAPHIGDNLIFLAAAYNAGPGAVASWIRNEHDVRDPLLFVEALPYVQTRDYVEHVVANYWVYSQILGGESTSLRSLAEGQWPRYQGAERQLVALLSRAQ